MLDPPDLPEETIAAAVRESYGIGVAALTFLPIGNDAATYVYRLRAASGGDIFLKLRTGAPNEPGFIVPRYLCEQGVTNVMAPLPTTTGGLWADLEEFTLALDPFVDGVTGTDAGMTERHWVTYGTTLRQMHDTKLPPEIAGRMRRENFVPDPRDAVGRVDKYLAGHAPHTFADLSQRELAAFWHDRRAEILALVERAEALGQRLRDANPPLMLCHADIHTWNILIDTAGKLWIVDWDETLLAPTECDLLFVVGGIGAGLVGQREEGWFFEGYGPATVDPLALAYYRHVRAVSDIGASGEQVFLSPQASAETRHAEADLVMRCFRPGNIVALAREADRLTEERRAVPRP